MQKIAESTIARRADDVLATTVEDEAVILELDSGTYYGFNETATFIWDRLEESRTVAELRKAILAEFDVDRERCEEDLRSTLAEMSEYGLVELDESN